MVKETQIASTVSEIMYMFSEKYLKALEKTLLDYGYYPKEFSIGGKSDMAECIENTGDDWEVFSFERGQKNNLKVFEDVYEACLFFIEEVSDSYEKEKDMKECFNKMIHASTSKASTQKLKDIISKFALTAATLTL